MKKNLSCHDLEKPDSYTMGYFIGRFLAHVGLGLALIILVSYGLAVASDWTHGNPSHQFVVCVVIAVVLFVVGWLIMLRRK